MMIDIHSWQAILVLMLFMHVFEDFYLQGIMAQLKQRIWWTNNIPAIYQDKCKRDYIPALFMHSLEWAICICLPLLLIMDDAMIWLAMIAVNTIIHMYIDDLKCNRYKINLCIDQSVHIVQIVITFLIGVMI